MWEAGTSSLVIKRAFLVETALISPYPSLPFPFLLLGSGNNTHNETIHYSKANTGAFRVYPPRIKENFVVYPSCSNSFMKSPSRMKESY